MLGRLKIWLGLAALVLAAVASAQQPDATVTAALASLTTQAGTVFAGEVIAIRPLGGIVQIDFRVDQALKGSSPGVYTLREWAGLWASGQPRYRIGDRAVLFLYPPSANGLSSPVDGMEGILPLSAAPSVLGQDAPTTLSADLRRLRTRVQRNVGSPIAGAPEFLPIDQVATIVRAVQPPVIDPIIHHGPAPIRLPAPIRKPMQIIRQLDAPL